MKQHAVAVLLTGSLILLTACGTSGIKAWSERTITGAPTYPQDQAVTLIEPFSIKIERASWADEFARPGYDAALPESVRRQLMVKPAAKFLIVDLSITNLRDKPAAWRSDSPPVFVLRNAAGAEYASVGQEVNMEDLTATIILGQTSNINPGMALRGKKVFDVPPGTYFLDVCRGVPAGGFNFTKGSRHFTWELAPQ